MHPDNREYVAGPDGHDIHDQGGPDSSVSRDHDDTGMRMLLAGLGDPGVRQDELADRLRRSLTRRDSTAPETRPLPPLEPSSSAHHGISHRALLMLAGSAVAAGLLGAMTLSLVDLPDGRVDEVLAANTLSGAGIRVRTSGTEYRTESLPHQAAALVANRIGQAPVASEAANNSGGGTQSAHAFTIGASLSGVSQSRASSRENLPLEHDVLACLRHLRIHVRNIEAVDLATLEGKPAAIVVTVDRGELSVRAIDSVCPVLGDAVLAGPSLLPRQP